jgi:flagellar biosynthetic protein FliO
LFGLDLGGEKLKRLIIITMAVCFIAINPSVLFSQEELVPQDIAAPIIDEEQFVFGQNLPADEENTDPIGGSTFSLILRMLLVLVFAAAAVYALVFFVKKISNPKKQEDPYLKVLSSASIGPNRSVHVISLGEKAWLVGSADSSVSLISEIDDKETLDAMLLDNSRNNADANGKLIDFRSIFMRLSGSQDDGQMPANLPKSENIKERRKRFKGF